MQQLAVSGRCGEKGTTMDYAKCIGRVGALAIAVGVGAAVATTPAIGYAAPTVGDSSADPSTAGGDAPAAAASVGSPASGASTAGSARAESADTADTSMPAGDSATTSAAGADSAPAVTVSSSGGAHSSTADDDPGTEDELSGGAVGSTDEPGSSPADGQEGEDTEPAAGAGVPAETPAAPEPAGHEPAIESADHGAQTSASGRDHYERPPQLPAEVEPGAAAVKVPSPATAEPSPTSAAEGPRLAVQAIEVPARRDTVADLAVAPAATALPSPIGELTAVADTVVGVASGLMSVALGPWLALAPGAPDSPTTALWALLAWSRREIGEAGQAVAGVVPNMGTQLVTVQSIDLPDITDPGSWISWAQDLLVSAGAWVRNTVVPVFFNRTPVATPQQVALTLAPGETSAPIVFDAYDPDGNRMTFTVNDSGNPGAPHKGTVTVDDATGTFTYTPDAGFIQGTDTFTVIVQYDTDFHLHALDFIFGTFSGHRDVATVTVFLNGAPTDSISGDFDLLTYNVADLPEPLSSARSPRSVDSRIISTLLNDYDVVNVQEDFAYHSDLIANSLFPSLTPPKVPTLLWPVGVPFADGLNTFSQFEIKNVVRVAWDKCSAAGANCLTPKGFTYTQLQLPGGQTVDLYNVHADTGGTGSSVPTTNDNLAQLSNFIQQNSVGRAVIVTGDFNTYYDVSGSDLAKFRDDNKFDDAWLQRSPCAPFCEELDKIYYRSATGADPGNPNDPTRPVILNAVAYHNDRGKFVDDQGHSLSDSPPITVKFTYTVKNFTAA